MDKNILKSKTFWLGVVTAIAPLFPVAQDFILENMEATGMVLGGIIVVIRKFTDKKVTLK